MNPMGAAVTLVGPLLVLGIAAWCIAMLWWYEPADDGSWDDMNNTGGPSDDGPSERGEHGEMVK